MRVQNNAKSRVGIEMAVPWWMCVPEADLSVKPNSVVGSSLFLHCTGSISMDWWRCSWCVKCKGVAVVTSKSRLLLGVQIQVLDSPVVTRKSLGNNRYYSYYRRCVMRNLQCVLPRGLVQRPSWRPFRRCYCRRLTSTL